MVGFSNSQLFQLLKSDQGAVMEKFRLSPITEIAGSLRELSRRLVGTDRQTVRRTVRQTLETARVSHEKEAKLATARETHHRRNHSAPLRSITPNTGMSLLRALDQQLELAEIAATPGVEGDQMIFSPQTYRDRYSLALLNESLRNTLTAVVGMMMVQHDYPQSKARRVFDLLIQDRSSVKPDSKFYGKRTEIEEHLGERFSKTDWFQPSASGKEIETRVLSESEAEDNYSLLELCARFLGKPLFSTRFNPDQPIPALISNGRNFDEENAVEHRRMQVVVSPSSFKYLIESLGYTNMKKHAKGPVLKAVVTSGNGDSSNSNGNYQPPLGEEPEVDTTQDEINDIINDYADSAQFRRLLKNPKLEVVVDGAVMSAPFAATSAGRRFELPNFAKYVQVFATQKGRRDIVSFLALRQTCIDKTWHSELELEGKQLVSLTVEPSMDDSGKITGSSLLVGYQPKVTLLDKLGAGLSGSWNSISELWPSLVTTPLFAAIIVILALVPLITIGVFSWSAFSAITLSLTAVLLVARWINPALKLIRLQQVAIDSFVALMLVAMLVLGILPVGQNASPAIAAVPADSRASTMSEGGFALRKSAVIIDGTRSISYNWAGSGSQIGSQFNLWDEDSNYYSTWNHPAALWNMGRFTSPNRISCPNFVGQRVAEIPSWMDSFSHQRITEPARTEAPSGSIAAVAETHDARDRAHVRKHQGSAVLHNVFHVEVVVNTGEMIKLIGEGTTEGGLREKDPSGTQVVAASPGNAGAANAATQTTSDNYAIGTDDAKLDATDTLAELESASRAGALVIFESRTQLATLNEGDVVNANFKSIPSDPRGVLLACTATGVVMEKRTSGSDVEIRVGLNLTWLHNGGTVNGKLDLLLVDCAKDPKNSVDGVLAVTQNQVAEVGRIELLLPKP
jgi:hypothetical protein